MCRLSEALVVVGCHAPGSASLHLGLLMVPRLRRWMPPTQLRKADLVTQEFWQSRLIQQSSNPTKFSEFSVLSVDKKWVVGVSPRQAFSCGSWLKNRLWAVSPCHGFSVYGLYEKDGVDEGIAIVVIFSPLSHCLAWNAMLLDAASTGGGIC